MPLQLVSGLPLLGRPLGGWLRIVKAVTLMSLLIQECFNYLGAGLCERPSLSQVMQEPLTGKLFDLSGLFHKVQVKGKLIDVLCNAR